jgi:hypothetical protein
MAGASLCEARKLALRLPLCTLERDIIANAGNAAEKDSKRSERIQAVGVAKIPLISGLLLHRVCFC